MNSNTFIGFMCFLIFGPCILNAQVKIGENADNINPYALLELESSNKGFILPKLSSTQRDDFFPLDKAPEGLIIYNTDTSELQILRVMFDPSTGKRSDTEKKVWESINQGKALLGEASSTPENPSPGTIFYNTEKKSLQIFDGESWVLNSVNSDNQALEYLRYVNGVLSISLENGGTVSTPLPLASVEHDYQQLSLNGTTLSLTNGGSVSLPNFVQSNQALSVGTGALNSSLIELNPGTPITLQVSGGLTIEENGSTIILGSHSENIYTTNNSLTNSRTIDLGSHSLQFKEANQNILTLLANQNVGIGTASPSVKLEVNGKIKATHVLGVSDKRFKTNIKEISNPLELIAKLHGVFFDWDTQNYPQFKGQSKQNLGFIAQDVEKILPQLVDTDQTAQGYKSVNYSNFVALLVEAIKAQQEMIQKQNEEIQSLKKHVQNIERKN